jgi:hypothetical protein
MRHRQGKHWYCVSDDRADLFAAQGYPVRQKANGKMMVLCHPSVLWPSELERKGITVVSLDDPAELHSTLKTALGEDAEAQVDAEIAHER